MIDYKHAEDIAANTLTRQATMIYLLDMLVGAVKTIAENTDTDIQQVKLESLQDGFNLISNGLFDIKETTKELIEIRYTLDDLVGELKKLNQTHEGCEEDLDSICENIGVAGAFIAESEEK